jgi:hypothetical protein
MSCIELETFVSLRWVVIHNHMKYTPPEVFQELGTLHQLK